MSEFFFKTNAKVEKLIGRELITNNTIAIFELVKNSYDAGAKEVELKFLNFYHHERGKNKVISNEDAIIEISDNGRGMTTNEIQDFWMELGTPYKEYNKYEEVRLRKNEIDIISKRTVNGEKGIGRFGVDKIGARLVMEAIDKDLTCKTIVNFNWNDFDNREKRIEEIPCNYETVPVSKNEHSGVTLKISKLRDKWVWTDVGNLIRNLKKFLSPIKLERDEFKIYITYPTMQDDKVIYQTEEIINDSFEYLSTSITAELKKNGIIYYDIYDNNKLVEEKEYTLFDRSPFGEATITVFYLDSADKKRFTDKMGLRTFQYGNIKIFKDTFRIMPYGDPHNDWLEIDNRHAQGVFRTFGTRDLVGYILLSHDVSKGNHVLKEATDRVGLIEDVVEFEQLKEFAWQVIKILEDYVFNRIEKQAKETTEILKKESVNLKAETTNLISSFKSIINKADLPQNEKKDILVQLDNNSKNLMQNIERVEVASKEIDKKIKIFSQISGTESFLFNILHKIKNKLAVIDSQINSFEMDAESEGLNIGTRELRIAFKSIVKMVEGTLKTINSYKAKKSIIKLEDLISSAIKYQYPRLKEEKVEVYTKFETRDINIKGNEEALLSNVFENLFDNTFKALVEIENKKISISTKLNNDFVEIYFSDNGVGIPEEKAPFIFSLWSSKEGSGIGLATARDTIKDHNGEIVYVDLGETNIETTFLIKLPVNK